MEPDELVLGCLTFDGLRLDYMELGGLELFDLNLQVEQKLNCEMFDGLKQDCTELGVLVQDEWGLDCQMMDDRELGGQELGDQMKMTFPLGS